MSRSVFKYLRLAGAAVFAALASSLVAQPAGVTAHRDLAYVTDGHDRQKLDLYLPEKSDGTPRPLILWIHGGGWRSGTKNGCPPLRQGFVARGYAVASLGYRLSQHAIFPAQIEDCKAAVRWLRAHAGEYELDPERFAAWGSSAGGHLAALLGTSGDVDAFDVGEHLKQSSRVQAVVDFYGPTDFDRFVATPGFQSHRGANSPESLLLGGLATERVELARLASPVSHVTPDDPPFLILHGAEDRTVPFSQSEQIHFALQRAGVRTQLFILTGAGHGGREFSDPVNRARVDAFLEHNLKQ